MPILGCKGTLAMKQKTIYPRLIPRRNRMGIWARATWPAFSFLTGGQGIPSLWNMNINSFPFVGVPTNDCPFTLFQPFLAVGVLTNGYSFTLSSHEIPVGGDTNRGYIIIFKRDAQLSAPPPLVSPPTAILLYYLPIIIRLVGTPTGGKLF